MKCLIKAFVVSLLLALVIPVRATTLVYKSFDDLVKEADGIVMGTVTNIESRKDARGRIYTYVTLGDLQMLHNRYEGKDFTLVMEGGRVGNEIEGIEGSPQFEYKERVILFVQGNGREIVPLVGWEQGVFRVQKDPESGQAIISDNEGNRVLAIENGQVVKEQRVQSEARIIGSPSAQYTYSGSAKGGAGVTEKGEALNIDSKGLSLTNSRPMRLEDFTKELQQRSGVTKAVPASLVSMTIGARIEGPDGADARPNPDQNQ